jgi:ABC-2 type transport system ATP-binding protein
VLTELRPAVGAGLEEMFLALTAEDAREPVTTGASA